MLDAPASDDTVMLGLLVIRGETVAVDVDHLAEVAHIDTLQKTLENQPGVLGLISVRGTLVPVCDPFGRYDEAAGGTGPDSAAVIVKDDEAIGLAVDNVLGLRRFHRADIQSMRGGGAGDHRLGTIAGENGALVNVLDAASLINNTSLPRAQSRLRKSRNTKRGATRPHLTFEAGGVFFAIPARNIFGTVPRRGIEDATLADGAYLGTITYFRRRVPIVQTNRVFGLGQASDSVTAETVVLCLPGDRLLGLAVDRIRYVALPSEDRFRPLKLQVDERMALLSATVEMDGVEHFLIDEERLHLDPHLKNAAELSDDDGAETETAAEDARLAASAGANQIEKLRDRFLVIDAGAPMALKMRDLRGLRAAPPPGEITACSSAVAGLEGLVFVDGQLVPLIDLARHLGLPDQGTEQSRVVLVQDRDLVVGFGIHNVKGVANSLWFSRQDCRVSENFDLVALRDDGETKVHNYLDITALAARIGDAWRRSQS